MTLRCFIVCARFPDPTTTPDMLELPHATTLAELRSMLSETGRTTNNSQFWECLPNSKPVPFSPVRLSEQNHHLQADATYYLCPTFSDGKAEPPVLAPQLPPPPQAPVITITSENNKNILHIHVDDRGRAQKTAPPAVRPKNFQPTIMSAFGIGASRNATLKQ